MKHGKMKDFEPMLDIVRVTGLNTLAIITSFQTDLEWWIRVSGMVLAAIYTVVKLHEHFTEKKKD